MVELILLKSTQPIKYLQFNSDKESTGCIDYFVINIRIIKPNCSRTYYNLTRYKAAEI